ncbi:hypothetical protein FRB97_006431 [Tulasnella sp. 331]|nr:hypothetical protein FRB97_006431 [Tulasnella sp. 331]
MFRYGIVGLACVAASSVVLVSSAPSPSSTPSPDAVTTTYDVLILGGGVAGIIAAEQLAQAGITDFMIVEGRDELGGRMRSYNFSGTTIELGTGPANPIWTLAKEHNVSVVFNDWEDLTFYDETGHHDFTDIYNDIGDAYDNMQIAADTRVDLRQVDNNVRTGFRLVGENYNNKYAWASEYYDFDWEYAQTPEYLIQAEAATFLKPNQTLLSSTVTNIAYTDSGVSVTTSGGKVLHAKFAIVTFSVGVLQQNDVTWTPALPHWKLEAIMTLKMATYTKIFLKFDEVFWDSTQMGLYADPYKRGYYPVWQSLDLPGFLPGSGIYFVTVTGDESERIENMTDSQVQAEVMAVLKNMYPNKTIPEPKGFYFQRWHSDPLYRGSFSNWPARYLHGAYTEGQSVGQTVAQCVKSNGCAALKSQGGADVQNDNKPFPPWNAPQEA